MSANFLSSFRFQIPDRRSGNRWHAPSAGVRERGLRPRPGAAPSGDGALRGQGGLPVTGGRAAGAWRQASFGSNPWAATSSRHRHSGFRTSQSIAAFEAVWSGNRTRDFRRGRSMLYPTELSRAANDRTRTCNLRPGRRSSHELHAHPVIRIPASVPSTATQPSRAGVHEALTVDVRSLMRGGGVYRYC